MRPRAETAVPIDGVERDRAAAEYEHLVAGWIRDWRTP
jgi:hypothetical protein